MSLTSAGAEVAAGGASLPGPRPDHPDQDGSDRDGSDRDGPDRDGPAPRDLRMPMVAVVAWAGALLGTVLHLLPVAVLAGLVVASGLVVARAARRGWRTLLVAVLVLWALAASAALRVELVAASPVTGLAADRAAVQVVATVTSDPRVLAGRFGEQRMVRVRVEQVTGRGHTWRVRSPVLVLGEPDELGPVVELGARVRLVGRLSPARGDDLSGVLGPSRPAEVLERPGAAWRGAAAVRASVRASVEHRPAAQAALVPALVDGDDADVDEELADDFRTTGLTHLIAAQGWSSL